MSREIQEQFYKLGLNLSNERLLLADFPVLSNLVGVFGEPILPELLRMINFFQEKRAQGLIFGVIFLGIPGSGKSTAKREFERLMNGLGFDHVLSYSYEEALADARRLLNKSDEEDIDYPVWQLTNTLLYERTLQPYLTEKNGVASRHTSSDAVGEYIDLECPGVSLLNGKRKRDRGTSFLSWLSKVMHKFPIYVVAITGDRSGQQKIVEHREKLLQLGSNNDEVVNAYLWANALLKDGLEINAYELIKLLEHMAMPHHLATIHREFDQHKASYLKKLSESRHAELLRIHQLLTGKKITEREAIVLIEMLTFSYFLGKLGVPSNRILSVHNAYVEGLQGAFYNDLVNAKT